MKNGFLHLIRFLTGTTDDGQEKPIIDLSPGVPDAETEIRIVRDNNHIGTAFGGDRVRIAKRELEQPTVTRVLLTEAEYAELVKNQAKQLIESLRPEVSPAMRAVDAGFHRQIEARKQQEERERVGAISESRSDIDDARLDRIAAQFVERLKSG